MRATRTRRAAASPATKLHGASPSRRAVREPVGARRETAPRCRRSPPAVANEIRARLPGVDLVHARDRARRHPIAGLQRPRAPRIQARAGSAATRTARPARRRRGRGRRSRRRRTTRTASPRRARAPAAAARGRRSGRRCCRSRRRSRSGPRSLIVASGLPAVSTPTCTAVDESQRLRAGPLDLAAAARRARARSRNSASTAAKPPANTGKRRRLPGVAQRTLRRKIGPARRSCLKTATRSRPMRPTFQPAIASGHSSIAASWHAYAAARSGGKRPGNAAERLAARRARRRAVARSSAACASTVRPPVLSSTQYPFVVGARRGDSRVWETGVIINILRPSGAAARTNGGRSSFGER